MRIPKRRSQILEIREEMEPTYVTKDALMRMRRTLIDFQRERPLIVEELSLARQKGDLSENAEYQDARTKLSRMDGRIFSLKEKIKNASLISAGPTKDGRIRVGSTVTVRSDGVIKTYVIVGSQEASPLHGRISHASPIGRALLDHAVGNTVFVETPNGTKEYRIEEVR